MQPVTAIVFDLDNTLIDRDRAFRELMDAWLGEKEIDSICELDQGGHGSREEMFRAVSSRLDFTETWQELWQRFQEEFPGYFSPDEAVLSLLSRINVPVSILTNGGSKLQRAKLKNSGIVNVVPPDRIFISEEIGSTKPDRQAFFAVHENPQRILYVGDQYETDMLGASRAGFHTCWISSNPPQNKPVGVDKIITQLLDLEKAWPGIT